MSITELLRETLVLTDGAWGTQLQALGLPVGACPDLWNLQHPDIVEQVPRAYVSAGSRVVLTNTFRANRIAVTTHGSDYSIEELNRRGVEISRRAAGSQAQVFGSIGPSGKLLVAGDITADELYEAFTEQSRALALAGADALLIETMSDIEEALIALAAARSTNLPVAVTMVFDTGQRRDRTMMGTTPEDCARALTSAGADIIGANCGQGMEGFVEIGRRLRSATDRPLWIKANAGMPQLVENNLVYPGTPAEFASFVKPLLDVGVTFIGGCCGTTPAFIAALRDALPIALAIAQ